MYRLSDASAYSIIPAPTCFNSYSLWYSYISICTIVHVSNSSLFTKKYYSTLVSENWWVQLLTYQVEMQPRWTIVNLDTAVFTACKLVTVPFVLKHFTCLVAVGRFGLDDNSVITLRFVSFILTINKLWHFLSPGRHWPEETFWSRSWVVSQYSVDRFQQRVSFATAEVSVIFFCWKKILA